MVEDCLEGGKKAILLGRKKLVEDAGGNRGVLDDFGNRGHPVAVLGNKVDDGSDGRSRWDSETCSAERPWWPPGRGPSSGRALAFPSLRCGDTVQGYPRSGSEVEPSIARGRWPKGSTTGETAPGSAPTGVRRRPAQQLDLTGPGPEWARLPPMRSRLQLGAG